MSLKADDTNSPPLLADAHVTSDVVQRPVSVPSPSQCDLTAKVISSSNLRPSTPLATPGGSGDCSYTNVVSPQLADYSKVSECVRFVLNDVYRAVSKERLSKCREVDISIYPVGFCIKLYIYTDQCSLCVFGSKLFPTSN